MIIIGFDEHIDDCNRLTKKNLTKENSTYEEWIAEACVLFPNVKASEAFRRKDYNDGLTILDHLITSY